MRQVASFVKYNNNNNMSGMSDRVMEEWTSLVKREESVAYKVHATCIASSSPSERGQDQTAGPPRECNQGKVSTDGMLKPSHMALREDVCDWFYKVVDHCDIDRDVVSIATSYFDRYLPLHKPMSETLMHLVAITSLFLAVKLHSTRKISAPSLSSLTRGRIQTEHILKMEMSIAETLHWYLNPPTPAMYLNVVSHLLIDESLVGAKDEVSSSSVATVQELSRYLIELTVCDGYFVDKDPSSIAYAAILVAMDILATPPEKREFFIDHRLEHSPKIVEPCARRIRLIYGIALGELGGGEVNDDATSFSGGRDPSPSSVIIY